MKARQVLSTDLRIWWDEHVKEESNPATATGLAEFIRDTLGPICFQAERGARFTPAFKSQTLGKALRTHLLEKLIAMKRI